MSATSLLKALLLELRRLLRGFLAGLPRADAHVTAGRSEFPGDHRPVPRSLPRDLESPDRLKGTSLGWFHIMRSVAGGLINGYRH